MTDMRYFNLYQQKKTSPQEAVRIVKSGDWVDYSLALNMPRALDAALAARAEELGNVKIRAILGTHEPAVFQANDRCGRNVFSWYSFHEGSFARKAQSKGYIQYVPMQYHELPGLYRRELDPVDVLMLQVTPMDDEGNFHFGPASSHIQAICEKARHILVEVNPRLPEVASLPGDEISVERVDAIVEHESEPDVMMSSPPSKEDEQIARKLLPMIADGSCLQLGIGGVPNAVGSLIAQSDLKDLGIHSELYADSMMEMTRSGKITGKYKSVLPQKQVFSIAVGSREMYDFMRDCPDLMAAPVDFVNAPSVICRMEKFVSINNAIQVDLTGQVNAESIGPKQISGTGGQLDFVRGAYHAKDGMSVIALHSTFRNRQGEVVSRIMPALDSGSVVTTPRSATHWVATEYGMVNLKGRSTWERAELLIQIAHPQFRESLIEEAEKMGIWKASNRR
ncbi:MAG: acetyl-CoA hydrolase/transferase C-terminal domain-containing protein [Peptoniphilaceae bacterium]|nr:acetyl-CoA hydrolase/transferase C-terminal domain-containing protein [Peptoniphilaceae bacterium]